MSDVKPTVKVKPWGKDQGDFVEINAEDFDPKQHKLIDGESAPEPVAEPELPADPELPPASAEKPVPRAKKPRRKKG